MSGQEKPLPIAIRTMIFREYMSYYKVYDLPTDITLPLPSSFIKDMTKIEDWINNGTNKKPNQQNT
jgi:hypothetical protein